MFTHKQAWRRQRHTRSPERAIHFEAAKIHESLNRSTSLPDFNAHNTKKSLEYATHRPHTMSSLTGKDKVVTFCDQSKVILIPCRNEYEKHGLLPEIWWDAEDYACFKASAHLEVIDLLAKHKGNIQCALAALYQPDKDSPQFLPTATATPISTTTENTSSTRVSIASSSSTAVGTDEDNSIEKDKQKTKAKELEQKLVERPVSCLRPPPEQEAQAQPPLFTRVARDSLRSFVDPAARAPAAVSKLPPPHVLKTPHVKPMHPLALMTS